MLCKINMFNLFLQFFLVVILVFPNIFGKKLEDDLRLLSKYLPGMYNNRQQYYHDVERNLPSERRHLYVQTTFRPVQIKFVPNSFNVYVEQFLNNENSPFKQWIYSFQIDEGAMALKMKIYNLLNHDVRQRIFKNLKKIDKLTADDIYSNSNCDMYWRRFNGNSFLGATGRLCLANFKGQQVRVAISATLTSDTLQWSEGWYSTQDGRSVIVNGGPYNMKKIKRIRGNLHDNGVETIRTPKHLEIKSEIQSDKPVNNELPEKSMRSYHSRKNPRFRGNNLRTKKKSRKPRYQALLRFEDIMTALTSGLKVYYFANITKCLVGGHRHVHRSSFGEYVDIFEIIQNGNDLERDYIKFSHRKKVREDTGFVEILRNIKVYRDGTALVDIYTIDPYHDQIVRQSMAVCKLQKRVGQIKFVTSSAEKLRTVKNFGSLRSSLRKGKPVRMIADFSKCSGGNGINPIIGGEFRDYDFLDDGETIEFSFERLVTNSNSENILTSQHVQGQFHRDSRAIFLLTDEEKSHNSYNNYIGSEKRYRCQIGKRNTAKGLRLYQT